MEETKQNKVKIKICGLSREDDISYANESRPDYVGFVFWPESKRAVESTKAARLKQLLHPQIQAVGVFVNEDPEWIISLLKKNIIDLAQLHGDESEEQIRRIRECTGRPVIKAVKVKRQEDLYVCQETEADYLLLDSGMGTGRTFDWSMINNIEKPFFLAGGLSPENVQEAVQRVHPFAVDVSSKVETCGKKDREKMHTIIRRVRNE